MSSGMEKDFLDFFYLISNVENQTGKEAVERFKKLYFVSKKRTASYDESFKLSISKIQPNEDKLVEELRVFLLVFFELQRKLVRLKCKNARFHQVPLPSRNELYSFLIENRAAWEVPDNSLMFDFFKSLLHEYKSGENESLKSNLEKIMKHKKLSCFLGACETGAFTFNKNNKSFSINDYAMSLMVKEHIKEKPKFLCFYAADELYLIKYFPQIVSSLKAISRGGGAAVLHVIFNSNTRKEVRQECIDIISLIESCANGAFGFQFILVSSVISEKWENPKSYFASARFLTPKLLGEFDCPMFFPDVDSMPFYDVISFLEERGSESLAVGSSNGFRHIYPWRRYLASQLVILKNHKQYLDFLEEEILSHASERESWFLDQNAIYNLINEGERKDIAYLDQDTDKFPFIQKRGITSF